MPKKEYNWEIGSKPPLIEAHTQMKHQIYQDYIVEYVKTLNKRPTIPAMNFAIVDAFAGGGLYIDKDNVEHHGSPVKIWQAMQAGEDAVNQDRDNKFTIKRKLFLLEKNKLNFNYLKQHLSNLEYDQWFDKDIIIKKGSFKDEYQSIIEEIQDKLSKKSRVIFVLDQYGYKDVPFADIRNIFEKLPNSEIILTLSVDDIIDYIAKPVRLNSPDMFGYIKGQAKNTNTLRKTFDRIGLDSSMMEDIKNNQSKNNWRALLEHHITEQLVFFTQAKYYSPFFLSREGSHKSMWLIHLANHSKAIDVMKTIYHEYGNQGKTTVSHYGGAGFDMLGYAGNKDIGDNDLFKDCDEYDFRKQAKEKSHEKLLEDILREIFNNNISFADLYNQHASNTPANKEMVHKAAINLLQYGEIGVKDRNPIKNIQNKDILLLNPQNSFSFFK